MEENIKVDYEQIEQANKQLRKIQIKRTNKDTGIVESKDYVPVSERIKAFRMVYPNGLIEPELIKDEDKICRYRVTIYEYEGGKKLASATAQEERGTGFVNKTSYIENCETSAVGRALGLCGFGVDNDLASADEVQNAIDKQDNLENLEATDEQIKIIAGMPSELKSTIRNFYGKDPIALNRKDAADAINSAIKRGLIKSPEDIKEEKLKEEIKRKESEEVF